MNKQKKIEIAVAVGAGVLVFAGIEKVKNFFSGLFGVFSGPESIFQTQDLTAPETAAAAANPDSTENTASIFDIGNLLD